MQEADAAPERAYEVGLGPSPEGEMSLLSCVLVIHRWRRMILRTVGASVLLVFVINLCLPNVYESTATIITPQEGSRDLGSMVALSGVAQTMTGLSMPSMTPNRDLFVSILDSRTLKEKTVEQFNLQARYGQAQMTGALGELEGRTDVTVTQEGVIAVKVHETDPRLAADIANFQVATLEGLLVNLKTTAASKQRAFISERLEKIKVELGETEEALRAFKVEHKLFGMDEQAKGIAEVVRDLAMEIAGYEAQLEFYRENFSPSNPELRQIESLVREKERQLNELKYGTTEKVSSSSPSTESSIGGLSAPRIAADGFEEKIYVPIIDLPEVGLDLARLTRDVVQKNTVYTLLVQELERAKISEARELLELQTLDPAVPADRRSRPLILLNTAIACGLGLFLSVFLAFVLEYAGRMREELGRLREARRGEHDVFDDLLPHGDDVATRSDENDAVKASASTTRDGGKAKASRHTKAPAARRRKRKTKRFEVG